MSLRWRWTLILLVFSAAVLAAVTITVERTVQAQAQREQERWQAGRQAQLRGELRALADVASRNLQRALDDPDLEPTLDDLAWAGAPALRAAADWAPSRGPELGVDALLVFDPLGKLISAQSPWPKTVLSGETRDFLWKALSFSPVLWRFGTAGPEDPWFLGARGSIRVSGGRRFVVVSGQRMDESELAELRQRSGARSLHWGEPAAHEESFVLPASWQMDRSAALAVDFGDAPANATLRTLRRRLLPVSAVVLLVVLLGSPWLASTMARPLTTMAEVVGDIGRGSRDVDLDVRGPRETRTLASALNRLSHDLSETEARMRTAERRAAWREIARRIAHEIRNSLSPLSLAVDNVQTAMQRGRDERSQGVIVTSLQTAREQLSSLDRLVREFHEFARAPRIVLAAFDPVELCRAALTSASIAYPQRRFEPEGPDELPLARGDSEQLRRALLNLLKNAAEASPESSPVRLRWGSEDEAWWVSVEDEGPGIPPELRARLGEPYLTTREGGTGLGLPVVLQVVEGHGGELCWSERQPRGWVMELRLPFRPPVADEEDAEPSAVDPSPPKGLS
jgi:signal transduction histidine kinase